MHPFLVRRFYLLLAGSAWGEITHAKIYCAAWGKSLAESEVNMRNPPVKPKRGYVNMRELVEDIGARYSDQIAYSYRTSPKNEEIERISYAALAEQIRCVACAAVDKGLAGKRVALIGKLSYQWVCAYLSLLSVGITAVPLDADWTADELAHTVKFAECEALFCSEEITDNLDIAMNELGADYSEEEVRLVRVKFISEMAN